MSINCVYRQIDPIEWDRLSNDQDAAMSYLFSPPGMSLAELTAKPTDPAEAAIHREKILRMMNDPQPDPKRVDLGGYWHALHFLLTGDTEMTPSHKPNNPLHNLVMGGRETTIESTYGRVRRFESNEVSELSLIFEQISPEQLQQRFDASSLNAHKIYPDPRPGGWDSEQIAGLWDIYPRLAQLVYNTIEDNNVLLLYYT